MPGAETMLIRPTTEKDLEACAAIYASAFAAPPYGEAWKLRDAAEMLDDLLQKDPDTCWCAEIDGRVEGFAFCTVYGRFRATIEEFAVAPGMQGQGIGTALMKHVIKELQSRGVQTADLAANKYAPAYAFYKRFGFRQPRDYVLMSRRL